MKVTEFSGGGGGVQTGFSLRRNDEWLLVTSHSVESTINVTGMVDISKFSDLVYIFNTETLNATFKEISSGQIPTRKHIFKCHPSFVVVLFQIDWYALWSQKSHPLTDGGISLAAKSGWYKCVTLVDPGLKQL